MGFGLEADCMVVVEGDDPGVVNEHGEAPVDPIGHQFERRGGDRRLE